MNKLKTIIFTTIFFLVVFLFFSNVQAYYSKTPNQARNWAKSQLPSGATLLYSIYDFETGTTFSYNGNLKTFPASMSKMLNLVVF